MPITMTVQSGDRVKTFTVSSDTITSTEYSKAFVLGWQAYLGGRESAMIAFEKTPEDQTRAPTSAFFMALAEGVNAAKSCLCG